MLACLRSSSRMIIGATDQEGIYIRCVEKSGVDSLKLTAKQMEDFGCWLFIDLASRTGQRGRPQKNPMSGVFSTRTFGKNPGVPQRGALRGSDFSRRLALWVHGWRSAGMSIRRACEMAAEQDLVKARLGKPVRGRRPRIPGEGVQEIELTVRTCYAAVGDKFCLDKMLRGYYIWFCEWVKWVVAADDRTLKFTAGLYPKTGPVSGEGFLQFAARLRKSGVLPEVPRDSNPPSRTCP